MTWGGVCVDPERSAPGPRTTGQAEAVGLADHDDLAAGSPRAAGCGHGELPVRRLSRDVEVPAKPRPPPPTSSRSATAVQAVELD